MILDQSGNVVQRIQMDAYGNVEQAIGMFPDEINYTGPIGLQCYAIKGDDRANLNKSITAWHALNR